MAKKLEVKSGNPWRDAGGRFSSPSKSQFVKYHKSKTDKKGTEEGKKDIFEGKELYDKYVFPNGDTYLLNKESKTVMFEDKRFKLDDPVKWLKNKTGYNDIEKFRL